MRLPFVLAALLATQHALAQCNINSANYVNCMARQHQLDRIEQNTRQAASAATMPASPPLNPGASAGAEAAGYALGRMLAERRNAKRQEREFREIWSNVDAAVAATPAVVPNALTAWQSCIVQAVPLFESPTAPAMEVAQRAHAHCAESLATYCIVAVSAATPKADEIDVAARAESVTACASNFRAEDIARAILTVRNGANDESR